MEATTRVHFRSDTNLREKIKKTASGGLIRLKNGSIEGLKVCSTKWVSFCSYLCHYNTFKNVFSYEVFHSDVAVAAWRVRKVNKQSKLNVLSLFEPFEPLSSFNLELVMTATTYETIYEAICETIYAINKTYKAHGVYEVYDVYEVYEVHEVY